MKLFEPQSIFLRLLIGKDFQTSSRKHYIKVTILVRSDRGLNNPYHVVIPFSDHYLCLDVKRLLVQLYGWKEGFKLNEMSDIAHSSCCSLPSLPDGRSVGRRPAGCGLPRLDRGGRQRAAVWALFCSFHSNAMLPGPGTPPMIPQDRLPCHVTNKNMY